MKISELQYKLNKFTKNGKDPEAQDVLEKIGYGIAILDACHEKALTWRRLRKEAVTLMGIQKMATAIQKQARTIASRLAMKFGKTGRVVFKGNEPILTRLGLYPSIWSSNAKQKANGSASAESNGAATTEAESGQTNGSSQGSSGPSMSTAAVIDRWRMSLEGALGLEEEHLARLTERGWGIAEINEALQAVEAYADADLDQTQKIRAQRETAAAARALKEELDEWYKEARSLTLLALADLPPEKAARLKELLGL